MRRVCPPLTALHLLPSHEPNRVRSRSRNAAWAGLIRSPAASRENHSARSTSGKSWNAAAARRPLHRERVRGDRARVQVALERPRLHDLARLLLDRAEVGQLARVRLGAGLLARTRGSRTPSRPRPPRARPSGSTTRRGPSWPRTARPGARAAPRAGRGGRAGSRRSAWPSVTSLAARVPNTAMALNADDIASLYAAHARGLVAYFARRTFDPQVASELMAETFAVRRRRSSRVPRLRRRGGGAGCTGSPATSSRTGTAAPPSSGGCSASSGSSRPC